MGDEQLVERGGFAYENWKASVAGEPPNSTLEFPLFTDARVTGELKDVYGPYQVLNAVPMFDTGLLMPALVLRIDYHAKYDTGMLLETNVERYHGGGLHDEIAALIALLLGIRLKSGGMTEGVNSFV